METNASTSGLKTMQLNDQKAGMQGLNKELINKIIYESSKGTPFFAFQEKRQKSIDLKVKEFKSILSKITDAEKSASLRKMNLLCSTLEAERDLSHSIVHIDMDAFYAAVEMEDNPELKGKPLAVGSSSMLSTSNYEARKYGVRAAMPGFIGKKLCPHLTIVPCNFKRYKEVSHMVRDIVHDYDPDYCPASLDELYMDLTEYIKDKHKKQIHQDVCLKRKHIAADSDYKLCLECSKDVSREEQDKLAYEIVKEIREKIFTTTNLTASAGIAPNVMLAKVGSDQNKPNGQYQILSTFEAVHAFVSSMPVKKVSGIGPVTGQILNAIGIHTCQDMFEKRDIIPILFKSSSADFFMRVALGISSTIVKSEHVRKSIGTEHTFREIHEAKDLHKKCRELCEEVVEDLKLRNLMGKLVVLKYKTVSFESHTRNQTLSSYSADMDVIHTAAKRLLDFEISAIAPKPLCLRLMGIRVANLTFEDTVTNNDKQIKIKDFLKAKTPVKTTSNNLPTSSSICEELSEPMHVFQDNDTLQNYEKEKSSNVSLSDLQPEVSKPTPQMSYICPVCNLNQIKTLTELNSHIDNCLNKAAIKEILAEDTLNKKRKQPLEEKQNTKRKMHLKGEKKIEDYFH